MAGKDVPGRPADFADLAIGYFISARSALRCGYFEVAGTLFHQAFELLFKASILGEIEERLQPGSDPERTEAEYQKSVDEYAEEADKVLRRTIEHNLEEAWRRFKDLHPDAALGAGLDAVVTQLHRWWSIRYPGSPPGVGNALTITPGDGLGPSVQGLDGTRLDVYQLSLGAMDELFAAVAPLDWNRGQVERWIEGRTVEHPPPGRAVYDWENRHSI
jgi:hypothetical protein